MSKPESFEAWKFQQGCRASRPFNSTDADDTAAHILEWCEDELAAMPEPNNGYDSAALGAVEELVGKLKMYIEGKGKQ